MKHVRYRGTSSKKARNGECTGTAGGALGSKHQVMYGNAAGDMEMYSTLGET